VSRIATAFFELGWCTVSPLADRLLQLRLFSSPFLPTRPDSTMPLPDSSVDVFLRFCVLDECLSGVFGLGVRFGCGVGNRYCEKTVV
jgi:hypothetical protein